MLIKTIMVKIGWGINFTEYQKNINNFLSSGIKVIDITQHQRNDCNGFILVISYEEDKAQTETPLEMNVLYTDNLVNYFINKKDIMFYKLCTSANIKEMKLDNDFPMIYTVFYYKMETKELNTEPNIEDEKK